MHSWCTWIAAAVSMMVCLWMLDDIWRLLYWSLVSKYHTVAKEKLMLMQARALCKCTDMEIDVVFDELSDTIVEICGPFLD